MKMDSYIQFTNMYIFDIFSGPFLFLLCALSISAYWSFNLKNLVQLSTIHFPVIWERNSPWKGLPIRKSATCDQTASTFFLWAGVTPAQLVKSLRGSLVLEVKEAACVGSLLLPHKPICYWGYTPSRNLSVFFKQWAGTMHLTLFKGRGSLPQAESAEIQTITSFSGLFHFLAWKGSYICRPKHLLLLPFFSSLQ